MKSLAASVYKWSAAQGAACQSSRENGSYAQSTYVGTWRNCLRPSCELQLGKWYVNVLIALPCHSRSSVDPKQDREFLLLLGRRAARQIDIQV
jgi:hypothetical protein